MKLNNKLKMLCESALNEGAGATVTFCFDEKDSDNAGSCDFTFEGTTVKVQNLIIKDYYYGDTAYDGGRIEFNKEEMIDALVKDYTENYGADISKEKIQDIEIVGIQELPNLHYSWGWIRTKLTGDEVLTWNEYNYGHYFPELQVNVYYTDETMEMLYVNVDGKYYPSEEVVEVYNCLGEEEDDEEEFEESLNESKQWLKVTDPDTVKTFKKGTKWKTVNMFGYKNNNYVEGDYKKEDGEFYHLMWDKNTDEVFIYEEPITENLKIIKKLERDKNYDAAMKLFLHNVNKIMTSIEGNKYRPEDVARFLPDLKYYADEMIEYFKDKYGNDVKF